MGPERGERVDERLAAEEGAADVTEPGQQLHVQVGDEPAVVSGALTGRP